MRPLRPPKPFLSSSGKGRKISSQREALAPEMQRLILEAATGGVLSATGRLEKSLENKPRRFSVLKRADWQAFTILYLGLFILLPTKNCKPIIKPPKHLYYKTRLKAYVYLLPPAYHNLSYITYMYTYL